MGKIKKAIQNIGAFEACLCFQSGLHLFIYHIIAIMWYDMHGGRKMCKMFKRMVSITMVLFMLISMLGNVTVFASASVPYQKTNKIYTISGTSFCQAELTAIYNGVDKGTLFWLDSSDKIVTDRDTIAKLTLVDKYVNVIKLDSSFVENFIIGNDELANASELYYKAISGSKMFDKLGNWFGSAWGTGASVLTGNPLKLGDLAFSIVSDAVSPETIKSMAFMDLLRLYSSNAVKYAELSNNALLNGDYTEYNTINQAVYYKFCVEASWAAFMHLASDDITKYKEQNDVAQFINESLNGLADSVIPDIPAIEMTKYITDGTVSLFEFAQYSGSDKVFYDTIDSRMASTLYNVDYNEVDNDVTIAKKLAQNNSTSSENTPSTSTTYYAGTYKITALNGLKFREGAGTNYSIIDNIAIPCNTVVTVVEISSNWGKITYNGKTGWICLGVEGDPYVTKQSGSSSGSTSSSSSQYGNIKLTDSNVDSYVGQKIVDVYNANVTVRITKNGVTSIVTHNPYVYDSYCDGGSKQCVDYVWGRIQDKLKFRPNWASGNGKDVASYAPNNRVLTSADGVEFTVKTYFDDSGANIKADSLVSFGAVSGNPYGHVIYVEHVKVTGGTTYVYYTHGGVEYYNSGVSGTLYKKTLSELMNTWGAYTGTVSFVSNGASTPSEPIPEEKVPGIYKIICTDPLKLREGPDTSYNQVNYYNGDPVFLHKNTEVTVEKITDGWGKVFYDGHYGWICFGQNGETWVELISKLPSFDLSFNANGGNGAPESQTKYQDITLTLSTTTPTRDGYTFLGWSTSASATTATYTAGGTYTANEEATLYAVWSKNAVVTPDATFTLVPTSGRVGDTVKMSLDFASSKAANSLAITGITYDASALTFLGFEDTDMIEDLSILPPTFDKDNKTIVIALKDPATSLSAICSLVFKINDTTDDGDYTVSASSVVKNGSSVIEYAVTNGKINVYSEILGDIDGDLDVDVDDAVALFRHSMLPEIYTINYKGNIDFDHNGTVDVDDAVAVFRYSMLPDIYPLA